MGTEDHHPWEEWEESPWVHLYSIELETCDGPWSGVLGREGKTAEERDKQTRGDPTEYIENRTACQS